MTKENIYGDLKSMNFNFKISEQLPFQSDMHLETISKIGPKNPISLSIFDFEFIKNATTILLEI